ncbi:MAG: DUF1577 domain-containing protein [Spirochaetales bacterium]|nr:DUF1577 domain-containing protein [Leptospiraceae bacterium]MCP5483194.1 DUF1577 domain-containing protein [Spirochaetales bacterium]MCP5486698.1 DUF1577 domain-containing protein [Spirochaetales bacterium]
MEHKRKDARQLERLEDPAKIQYLIEKHLSQHYLFVKGFDPPYRVKIAGYEPPRNLSVDMGEYEPEDGTKLTLFRILGRYIHLECMVARHSGSGNLYEVMITGAAIARKERSALRIPVQDGEAHISNIRASKHTIDASLYNIPTSVKVNFSTYEQTLKGQADVVKIDVFGKRGTILDEIRKTGRSLFVRNTQDPGDYTALDDAFVDYAEFLDDALQKRIHEYNHAKVKSEIIVPVVYLTHDNSRIPLGYIQIQSRTEHFERDRALELQQTAFEMVDRIRDSNTVLIQERQEVVNVSRGGIKVLISHKDLKEYLVRQNGFTFDLFFKMQAPVTLYGLIRSAYKSKDGDLLLGVQISGTSSREGEYKRYSDNVDALERRAREAIEKRKQLMGKSTKPRPDALRQL